MSINAQARAFAKLDTNVLFADESDEEDQSHQSLEILNQAPEKIVNEYNEKVPSLS
jgi:hypothetical protein